MKDFISFIESMIKLVNNTPIPIILVVAGLFFLFLAIGGRFGAKIVTDRVKEKYAWVLGTILLFAGLALSLVQPEEKVVVPNVVGLQLGKVKTNLNGSHLKVGSVEKSAQDATATVGIVLKQKPQAGVEVSKGKAVNLIVGSEPDNIIKIARENWLQGNYDAALDAFALVVQKSNKPKAKKIAGMRLEWLDSYRGRIIFADDLEIDSIGTEKRWILHPPGPGTGTGEFERIKEDENFVLEGRGHYHAKANINSDAIIQNFEIQLRFRPLSPQKDGAHINIMMDEIEGRSTVGLNMTENILSLWEEKNGRETETHAESPQPFESRWYMLRIVAEGKHVRIFLDGEPVLDYTSPRSQIFLKEFNIESLSGKIQFDDLLVIYH